MLTPYSFKITVTEISETDSTRPEESEKTFTREVFAMAVPAEDFNLQSFVQAITKPKRGRKARGKETA